MSRERDAIELIWGVLGLRNERQNDGNLLDQIEQILTMTEDLIQEDLEQMESSCRSRETLKTNPPSFPGAFENKLPPSKTEGEWNKARFFGHYCPLIEEYKKSQEATNTKTFWQSGMAFPAEIISGDPAEGDTYSPI